MTSNAGGLSDMEVHLKNLDSRYKRNKVKAVSHKNNKNVAKMQMSKSLSVGNIEEKVLNVESKYDIFMSISEAFENTINELEIDYNYEEIYEKLINIQILLKEKISFFEEIIAMKDRNLKHSLKNKDLKLSKLLTSSIQSLNFEGSNSDNCSVDNPLSTEFFMKVNCPFCSKSETDKISLIKHLDEDCLPHKHKKFEKSSFIPYSVFQILPNNTFKCNICPNSVHRCLKKYITHLLTEPHTSNHAKAVKTKCYSEYLFCSCCKIQVPNSYTQINFHVNHEAHKIRSSCLPVKENFLKRGIYCVFLKSRKFKCLICPQSIYDTCEGILKHLKDLRHLKRIRNTNYCIVHCEFCCSNVHTVNVDYHFNGSEHKKKVEKEKEDAFLEESFELCFYCGYMCYDLEALSLHMGGKCREINDLRKKNLWLVKPNKGTSLKDKATEKSGNEDNTKKGHYIIVKDFTDIPKLFVYFKKFGEIDAIETYKEKNVAIKFHEKRTVKEILCVRNVLKINGVELKIAADENICESDEQIERSSKSSKSFEENKKVPVSHTVREEDDSSSDETDGSDNVIQDDDLQILFQRVSSHLVNNAQKSECELQKKILHDCAETLRTRACDIVGFSGCGLSFPLENLSVFCDAEEFFEEFPTEFSLLKKTKIFNHNVIEAYYTQMNDSHLWKYVTSFYTPFEYIKCEHRETKKVCTIIFSPFARMLTNMLRECLENNSVVRCFCLIIRFWLCIHKLKIKEAEYAIISILIFFLISEEIVTIPLDKYKIPDMSSLDIAVKGTFKFRKPSSFGRDFDVKGLFQKFLLFLDAFDFDKNAICLPIQHPLPKELLMKDTTKFILNMSDSDRLVNSSMCILDPTLNKNLAANVNEEDKKSFLDIVRNTIKHYNFK